MQCMQFVLENNLIPFGPLKCFLLAAKNMMHAETETPKGTT